MNSLQKDLNISFCHFCQEIHSYTVKPHFMVTLSKVDLCYTDKSKVRTPAINKPLKQTIFIVTTLCISLYL